MCYSAQIHAEFSKFRRETGATMDVESYMRVYWWQEGKRRRPKVPRAVERDILKHGPAELADLVERWDIWEAGQLALDIVEHIERISDGQQALAKKVTKKAQDDVRIGAKNMRAARRRVDVLGGKPSDTDRRIFPGVYCPVLVSEGGKRVVKLMRYQCRPAGKPVLYDRKYRGTYNAFGTLLTVSVKIL